MRNTKHVRLRFRWLLYLLSPLIVLSIAEGRNIPQSTVPSLPSVFEALTQKKFYDQLRIPARSSKGIHSSRMLTLSGHKTQNPMATGGLEKSFHRSKHFSSVRHHPPGESRRRKLADQGGSDSGAPSTGLILPGLGVGPSLSDINSTLYRWDSIVPPAEIDWRNVSSSLTMVHNQQRCSSCWAMATSDSISIMWNLRNALRSNSSFSNPESLSPLGITTRDMSPQQVCDCSLGSCCSGGWPEWGLSYAMFQGGLTNWLEYPYVASDEQCNSTLSKDVKAKITGWEQVPAGDVMAMKKAVSQQPVIAFVSSSSDDFVKYKGGVYQGRCSQELDHVVLIVGYANDSTFGPYWIIKNSWGSSWGENGYMRIAMTSGSGTCGITSIPALFPVYHPYSENPCDAFPPPCGAGTCYVDTSGTDEGMARCACPPGYVENLQGVAKCVSASPCSRNPNPCNLGQCTDLSDGSYTCTCPEGTVLGSRTDGGSTCVFGHGAGGVSTYVAAFGDTCELVSQSYGMDLDKFMEYNSFLDCNFSIPEGTVVAVSDDDIQSGCSRTHIVQAGDTCESIQAAYGLSTSDLLSANPLLNCSQLLEHQLVCVSNVSMELSSDSRVVVCQKTYSARPGDSCASVMKTFGLSSSKFTWLNPGVSCKKSLPTSLALCVSNETAIADTFNCTEWYRVQQGDTCPSIWIGANLTQEIFLLYNPGIRCQAPYLQIGQQVCIKGPITPKESGSLIPYLVKPGDSLTGIAQTFRTRCPGLNSNAISQVNFQSNTNVSLIPGSTLLLPCTSKGVGRICGCSPTTTVCGMRGNVYTSLCDASCNYDTPATAGSCTGTCQSYCKGRVTLAPAAGAPSYCTKPCPFPVWPPPSDWNMFSTTQCSFYLNQCTAVCTDLANASALATSPIWKSTYTTCYTSCKSKTKC